MGLLDWLISDTGSSGSTGFNGNPMMTDTSPQGDPTGLTPKVPAAPPQNWQSPFVAATNSYASPGSGTGGSEMPYPVGSDPMTAGGPSGSAQPDGGLPTSPVPMPRPRPAAADAQPPVPLPRPRPAGAPGLAGPDVSIPTNATSTQGSGMPGPAPGMAPQEQPIAQPPAGPTTAGGGQGLLQRALGIDPNRAKEIKGALAGGLTAAAANSNKPGLAAFAAGAGGGLKGSADAENKIEDKQSKALNDAIKAAQLGDTSALNKARTQLALAQAQQVTAGNGKGSVLNTQEQLYLRGLGAVNNDPQVKASAAQLRAMATQGYKPDSPEYKAAQEAHTKLIDATKQRVFGTLGVDEKTAGSIAKKPGFSQDNPVPREGLTQEKFDQLPTGAYFINPADGRLLVKQPPAANPATPAAATPTPALPTPVTAPAGSAADSEE